MCKEFNKISQNIYIFNQSIYVVLINQRRTCYLINYIVDGDCIFIVKYKCPAMI